MTFDEYQLLAAETAVYPPNYRVTYPALGLNGEAGEVAELIKKQLRDETEPFLSIEFLERAEKELGDVLWYLSALADDLGMSLEMIAQRNYAKLKSRQERGSLHGSGDDR